jgi:hypothetical protein
MYAESLLMKMRSSAYASGLLASGRERGSQIQADSSCRGLEEHGKTDLLIDL